MDENRHGVLELFEVEQKIFSCLAEHTTLDVAWPLEPECQASLCGIEDDMFYHRCGNAEGEMGDNLPALDFGFVWAQID